MLRSKRGTFGLAIIVISFIVALSAPLMTPYNPIFSTELSGKLVPPTWTRYLPGGGSLSQNFIAVSESSLLHNTNPLGQFNFTVTGSAQAVSNTATVNPAPSAFSASLLPTSAILNVGQSLNFTSTVSGGTLPYKYQWYLDGNQVLSVNQTTWTFTPSWPQGVLTHSVYVLVTDKQFHVTYSNTATISLEGLLIASVSPRSVTLNVNQTQVFTSNITGGNGLYSYQWYLDGSPVSGANNDTWTFTPSSQGAHSVYLKVTDNIAPQASQDAVVQYSSFGATGSNGSLAIIFQPQGIPINSNVTIQIMRDYYYPYSGGPGAVISSGTLLASKLDGVDISPTFILEQKWLAAPGGSMVLAYNITKFEWGRNPTKPNIPGPAHYSQNQFTNYSLLSPVESYYLGWQAPLQLFPIEATDDPAIVQALFPRAGTYSFGLSITATKKTANSEAIVYLSNLQLNLQGSSFGWLGTDPEGRDVFTQLVYGTQVSLYVGLVAAFFSTILGLVVGLVAAYMGGLVDEVLMRFTDALLVLPSLPLMIVLIIALSGGNYNINILILVFGVLGWQGFARVVRSQVLSLKERPYVEAAKAVGAGTPYILWRHILPNVVVLIYVTLALTVPAAIVTEAAFAFLGFIDITHMSWGQMLNAISSSNPAIWWMVLPPGLAIMILSLSFILIGYAIDDILNPKLRARR